MRSRPWETFPLNHSAGSACFFHSHEYALQHIFSGVFSSSSFHSPLNYVTIRLNVNVQNTIFECSEVGMYLAMSRQAIREGYPEIGAFYEKAAMEEAEHAAHFAELLGEVLTDSTKKNLEMRADAEYGATQGRADLAKKAKALNLDAIHDIVHEIGRDEARHGKGFEGLLKRYFGK